MHSSGSLQSSVHRAGSQALAAGEIALPHDHEDMNEAMHDLFNTVLSKGFLYKAAHGMTYFMRSMDSLVRAEGMNTS